MSRRQHIRRRQGMTLIELLVVIFIILLITAIAIPVVAPSLESRRGRETSRLLTSFIQSARTRAIQTGRPCGVAFKFSGDLPLPALPNTAIGDVLHQVEVPPPYAGDNVGSTMTVLAKTVPSNTFTNVGFTGADSGWIGLLRPNDLIKFNYQGRWYQLGVVNPGTDIDVNGFFTVAAAAFTITPIDGTGIVPPPGLYPFQIHRLPVFTSAAPLLLPAGIVIDMGYSGYDANNVFGVGQCAVVLFSPNGSMISVINSLGNPATPTSPLHLLVGKVEQFGQTGSVAPDLANFRDLTNFWVSIHPQTGLVSSTEVAGEGSVVSNNDGTIDLFESRYFAQQAQSLGGR